MLIIFFWLLIIITMLEYIKIILSILLQLKIITLTKRMP